MIVTLDVNSIGMITSVRNVIVLIIMPTMHVHRYFCQGSESIGDPTPEIYASTQESLTPNPKINPCRFQVYSVAKVAIRDTIRITLNP